MTTKAGAAPQRPKRTPLGRRNVLTVAKKDKRFAYRFFNDQDDRLQRAQEAGYEFVRKDTQVGDPQAGDPSKMGDAVSKHVGSGVTAYLMRIPRKYYEEDQKEKVREALETEKALGLEFTGSDGLGKYGKISVTSSLNQESNNGES